ncbi:MAG: YtxH domain-containing protein [Chloroflexota bacterium]|nr:YtxH domain-containing protein [Chloroflexota bacterium]
MIRFLLGFILGVMAGLCLAICLAPTSGRQIRERLGEAWREGGGEETPTQAQEAMQRMRSGWETLRQRVEEAIRAGREAQTEAEQELRARREELAKKAGS